MKRKLTSFSISCGWGNSNITVTLVRVDEDGNISTSIFDGFKTKEEAEEFGRNKVKEEEENGK